MTDREMLELAAKAAGYNVTVFTGWENDGAATFYINDTIYWNPREDDGDALRLLVIKRFWIKDFAPIQHSEITQSPPDGAAFGMIEIWRETDDDPIHVEWYKAGADRNAATRRAIVRAAAEIGRSVK